MDATQIAFQATNAEFSFFPEDCGSGTYKLRAHEYERMENGSIHEFNPNVQVYIPDNHVGRITVNPEHSDIEVTERNFSGGKWHDLKFIVKYKGFPSMKLYGSWGLANLIVSKCE